MNKPPKYPVHDHARDGNAFHWILRAAADLREKQQMPVTRIRFDPLTGKPVVKNPGRIR